MEFPNQNNDLSQSERYRLLRNKSENAPENAPENATENAPEKHYWKYLYSKN